MLATAIEPLATPPTTSRVPFATPPTTSRTEREKLRWREKLLTGRGPGAAAASASAPAAMVVVQRCSRDAVPCLAAVGRVPLADSRAELPSLAIVVHLYSALMAAKAACHQPC